MASSYLTEAFKRLDLIEEAMFDSSASGINNLSSFMEEDDDIIRVIDPKAEDKTELQDSYVGKVIINCNICHSHIFEDKENIVLDEEGNVNMEEVCPYCGEEEGFTIVGEIAPFNKETPVEEPEEDTTDVEIEEDSEEAPLEEGLFDFGKRKKEVAARNQANSANRAAKYKEAQEKALANTTVVVKMYRDHSQNPKIEDYYDLAQNADLQVRKLTNMERDKNIVYNAMSAKAAQKYGAFVSLPQRFVDKYLKEALGIGAGLALGGAAIGAGMIGSSLLDDVNDSDDDELLNEDDVTMSRATRRSMTEDFKEVSITTEDQKLEMSSDENGKVTVTTEPVQNMSDDVFSEDGVEGEDGIASDDETIVPVSDETEEEILANNEESSKEDETESEEDMEIDFEDIDEEGMDELGESYLRKVYENVESFKTTSVGANSSAIIVEGVIKFASGAQKKTGFIFEAKDANNKGQVRFTGSNKHLCESANAFTLVGKVDNKKLFVESLKYNYKVNNDTVRGIVRKK